MATFKKPVDTTAARETVHKQADSATSRASNRRASHYDEDEDRRYVEKERAQLSGRRRTVFDAADEMDNPGLEDDRDVMSGRDRGVPTHEEARIAREGRDTDRPARDKRP